MYKEALKIVFSNSRYLVLSGCIAGIFSLILLQANQFLFFQPYVVLSLPVTLVLNFALLLITSVLTGLVSGMAAYKIRRLKSSIRRSGGGLFASLVGTITAICTACGGIAIPIFASFGVAGVSAFSFITSYKIPIQLATIAVLITTYFLMAKEITSECKVKI